MRFTDTMGRLSVGWGRSITSLRVGRLVLLLLLLARPIFSSSSQVPTANASRSALR